MKKIIAAVGLWTTIILSILVIMFLTSIIGQVFEIYMDKILTIEGTALITAFILSFIIRIE